MSLDYSYTKLSLRGGAHTNNYKIITVIHVNALYTYGKKMTQIEFNDLSFILLFDRQVRKIKIIF